MVFVFQPIFMSYLPRPRIRERSWLSRSSKGNRDGVFHRFVDWLVKVPVTPGFTRSAFLAGGAIFILFGVVSGQRAKIGYQTPGTPLYRQDSKVNLDIAEIGKYFPTDIGWIVLSAADYPDPQSSIGPEVMRMSDDLEAYLISRGDAVSVPSFTTVAIKPLNMMFHNGYPKYESIPGGTELGGNLWYMFLGGTAPGEMERFFAHTPHMTSSCIRVLLPDHTFNRLNQVREDIKRFIDERVTTDPALSKVHFAYLGGVAGLYLAANDVLYRLDLVNLTFVLLVIYRPDHRHYPGDFAGHRTRRRLWHLHGRANSRRSDGRGDRQRGGRDGITLHGSVGLQHLCGDDRRDSAVGIFAAAVSQRDERAADFPDGDEHDRGRADPAGVYRMAAAALHHAVRNGSRARAARRRKLTD
jgi:hypothetical protein